MTGKPNVASFVEKSTFDRYARHNSSTLPSPTYCEILNLVIVWIVIEYYNMSVHLTQSGCADTAEVVIKEDNMIDINV